MVTDRVANPPLNLSKEDSFEIESVASRPEKEGGIRKLGAILVHFSLMLQWKRFGPAKTATLDVLRGYPHLIEMYEKAGLVTYFPLAYYEGSEFGTVPSNWFHDDTFQQVQTFDVPMFGKFSEAFPIIAKNLPILLVRLTSFHAAISLLRAPLPLPCLLPHLPQLPLSCLLLHWLHPLIIRRSDTL